MVFRLVKPRILLSNLGGQADNARFNALVTLCVLKQDKRSVVWENLEDYNNDAEQPWASEAAGELASLIYEIDPNYDNSLEENKFLKAYNFANKENQLVNEDGHRIFVDEEDGHEYLIDENFRFVAYRTDKGYKNQDVEDRYFVIKEGKEVTEDGELVEDDFSPFLDETAEETTEETAEVEENTPKKRGRPKKTEEVS